MKHLGTFSVWITTYKALKAQFHRANMDDGRALRDVFVATAMDIAKNAWDTSKGQPCPKKFTLTTLQLPESKKHYPTKDCTGSVLLWLARSSILGAETLTGTTPLGLPRSSAVFQVEDEMQGKEALNLVRNTFYVPQTGIIAARVFGEY